MINSPGLVTLGWFDPTPGRHAPLQAARKGEETMSKSAYWFVTKWLDEDCGEVMDTFANRDDAEAYASHLADEYPGDRFTVQGNNASSPCWTS